MSFFVAQFFFQVILEFMILPQHYTPTSDTILKLNDTNIAVNDKFPQRRRYSFQRITSTGYETNYRYCFKRLLREFTQGYVVREISLFRVYIALSEE